MREGALTLPSFSMLELFSNQWLSSHDWRENVPCPATPKEIAGWQKRLNVIYGTIDGIAPVVRVTWGQSPDTWYFNRYWKEWTPRYDWGFAERLVVDPKTKIETKHRVWIGLPRLILERALRPQTRNRQHQSHHDAQGVSVARHIPSGIIEYRLFSVGDRSGVIVQHSETRNAQGERICCATQRDTGDRICYGDYRPLDELDFEFLAREERQTQMQSRAHAAGLIVLN